MLDILFMNKNCNSLFFLVREKNEKISQLSIRFLSIKKFEL